MTSIFGGQVADEWQTVFPLLARHYAAICGREPAPAACGARRWPGAGRHAERGAGGDGTGLIQKTHWPNIDLIGAQLNLYWAEFQIPVWRMQAPRMEALGRADREPGRRWCAGTVRPRLPRYAPGAWLPDDQRLAAADILLVPLGASFLEFDSTGRFFDMLHATFGSIEEAENMAARALGLSETRFEWDAVRAVLTPATTAPSKQNWRR
jgi:chromosome partitioning protein